MDFEKMSVNITKAFNFCKVVEQLDYFANFKHTIDGMNILNTAHTTPGADHFADFRCSVFQIPGIVISCGITVTLYNEL